MQYTALKIREITSFSSYIGHQENFICHKPIFRNIPKIINIKMMFSDLNVVKLDINKKSTTSILPTSGKIKSHFSIISESKNNECKHQKIKAKNTAHKGLEDGI